MSEHPTPSPERTSVPSTLTLDDIQTLREEQVRLFDSEVLMQTDAAIRDQKRAEVYARYDEMTDELLRRKGLEDGDPRFATNKAVIDEFSLRNIPPNHWNAGHTTPEGVYVPAGAARLNERLVEVRDTTPDTPVTTPEAAAERELTLDELAAAKHNAFAAKVNAPVYGKRRGEALKAYDEAERDYTLALERDVESKMAAMPDGLSEAEQKEYIERVVNERLAADNAAQYQTLVDNSGYRGKFLAKYSEMSRGQKIATGVGLGLLGAAGGFGLGLLGAGVATVAGGAAGYRLGKTYLLGTSEVYRKPTDDPAFVYDKEGTPVYLQASEYARVQSREKIVAAEKTKKRAIMMGMGAAALGGAIGVLAHAPIADKVPTSGHWPAGYLHHDFDVDAPRIDVPEPSIDVDVPEPGDVVVNGPDLGETYNWGPSTLDQIDSTGSMHEITDPTLAHENAVNSYIDSHADALTIEKGEGWYQTFKEFGVPSQYRDDLLKEIGPKLQKMGEAYKTPDGLWGIKHPGELSDDARQLIVEKANDHGWIKLDVVDATSAEPLVIEDTLEISKGGGIVSEARDFGITGLTESEIDKIGAALHEEGSAYKSDYLADTYGNQYGLKYDVAGDATAAGEFRPGAADIFNDFADNRELDGSTGNGTVDAAPSRSADVDTSNTWSGYENLNEDGAGVERSVNAIDLNNWVKSGDIAKLNMLDTEHATAIAESVKDVTYSNGTPVARFDVPTSSWKFNDVPYGLTVPSEVQKAVAAYAGEHAYDLAA